jgi:hypothetical protein
VLIPQDIYQQTYLEQPEGAALSREELLGSSEVTEREETAGDHSHQKPAVKLTSGAQKGLNALGKKRVQDGGAEDGT